MEGGNLKSDGFYANARSGAGVPENGYVDTEFGRLRRGALPGTLLSHAILGSDDPIRALFVTAIINGLVAPPLLVLIVLLGTDRGIMGKRTSGWVSRSLTWTATAVMSVAAVALLTTLIRR